MRNRRPQLVSWPVWNLEEKGRSVGVHQKGRASGKVLAGVCVGEKNLRLPGAGGGG